MTEVAVSDLHIARFREVQSEEQVAELERRAEQAREMLSGRSLWCINSTAQGGGVAEMLMPLLGYSRGSGVDARWAVISGDPAFFAVTKRLHHRLHGMPGDGGPLGDEERQVYERAQERNAREMLALIAPGDVVLVHDPQPAGLIGPLVDHGCRVIWRSHVGSDLDNELVREAWAFLTPHVDRAHAFVFSRRAYIWDVLDVDRSFVIPPSIDVFSPKNQELMPGAAHAILRAAGLVEGPAADEPRYLRSDGTIGLVAARARLDEDAPWHPDAPLILQVSRWDPLKDPVGVIDGFAARARDADSTHLMLAGPDVASVSDDPEGAVVYEQVRARREQLPADVRARVHLASLAMDDVEENGATVNALQRSAMVVVQKSLAEGFGLTVAEALWKARPVVASRVGGIQDQVADGTTGLLLDDPRDPEEFGEALLALVGDPQRSHAMGLAGRESVRDNFLESRHLLDWVDLLERVGV